MPDSQNPASEPGRELALSQAQSSRQLIVSALRTGFSGLKLGCSLAFVSKLVTTHRLTEDQIGTLLAVRSEYNASIPAVMKLYAKGVDLDTIRDLYTAREGLKGHDGCELSLVELLRLRLAFHLEDYESDDVADLIMDAHQTVAGNSEWIRYASQTVALLLQYSKSYPEASLEAAVEMVRGR